MFNTPSDLLCNSCGIRCQVMYSLAPLEDDEILVYGCKSLRLPCPYSRGGCLVYGHRPKICSDYVCSLLVRFQRGEIGMMEGRRIVLEAKILITYLEILLTPWVPEPLRLVNDMVVEILNGQGKKAGDLIQEYESGKYRDKIPPLALSNIDELHRLLVDNFYHGADLEVKKT